MLAGLRMKFLKTNERRRRLDLDITEQPNYAEFRVLEYHSKGRQQAPGV